MPIRRDRGRATAPPRAGGRSRSRSRVEPGDRGLRIEPHDLVGLGPIAGGGVHPLVEQFLDQLGARGLVLDEHDIGPPAAMLVLHSALQFRVVEALAHDVDEIKVLSRDAPVRWIRNSLHNTSAVIASEAKQSRATNDRMR